MRGLTARQKEVLKFLEHWWREHRFSPSVREIALHFGIQLNAVERHLRALESKGVIERARGKARALALRGASDFRKWEPREKYGALFSGNRIPLVAVVPAGAPRSVEEQSGEFVDFSPEWFGSGELRAVRVSGDSMSGDAIRDGDIAILRIQPDADPGDIVAVRVENEEVTLKRVRKRGHRWVDLIPSNPEHPVRRVPAHKVELIGKLVGILRRTPG